MNDDSYMLCCNMPVTKMQCAAIDITGKLEHNSAWVVMAQHSPAQPSMAQHGSGQPSMAQRGLGHKTMQLF